MTTFYRVDGGKLTYAEYWRMSPEPFSFCIAATMKLFGFPIKFNFAIPRPDRLFLVDFEEFPGGVRSAVRKPLRSAEKAGLRMEFCHRLAVPEPNRFGGAILFLDDENTTSLMVMVGQHGDHREVQATCASRFADDSLATTTTMKKTMKPVPGQDIERYPGMTPGELYRLHLDHVQRLEGEGLVPVALQPAKLAEFVLECELRYVDFHIGRSVFVPMTEDELDAISGE